MSNTIELLSAIGQDASLRHATAEELASILDQAKASDAMKAAVAAGDSSLLTRELGQRSNVPPQVSNVPGYEEEEPLEEEGDEPLTPSEPGTDMPTRR